MEKGKSGPQSREIGSEFWQVPEGGGNSLFPPGTEWYLSGRHALRAILRELGHCRSACLPSWCCDSMILPFREAGLSVSFYPYDADAGQIERMSRHQDILFVMDYFGYGTRPAPFHPCVIRDVTHSLFSASPADADYYFGSLRKWCGVPTGGFAWAGNGRPLSPGTEGGADYTALRRKAMEEKAAYLAEAGKGGPDRGKTYLALFAKAEDMLDREGIFAADPEDVLLARRLDPDGIRRQRRANAALLREAFPDWLIFPEMKEEDCPLFVPVLVPDGRRDALRARLISRDIYCPVHWPVTPYHLLDKEAEKLYNNELSLICDQRYSEADIRREINTVREFWENT